MEFDPKDPEHWKTPLVEFSSMDIVQKSKVSIQLVATWVVMAFSVGGAYVKMGAKDEALEYRLDQAEKRVAALEVLVNEQTPRLVRIETLLEQLAKDMRRVNRLKGIEE